MTDEAKVQAVIARLEGVMCVGAQVEVIHSGKRGTVIRIRQDSVFTWIRVQFPVSNGHWEYSSPELRLL